MRAGAVVVAWLAAGLAAPAIAQPPADPIGELLQRRAADPDAENAPAPADPTGPRAPEPYAAPAGPGAPVFLDDRAPTSQTPPSPSDIAYEARLRASSASARGIHGPLEGGWILSADGADLYAFELADRGAGVEGAWRDLAKVSALEASGFIDHVERDGRRLVLRFDGGRRLARLEDAGGGSWRGELEESGTVRRAVLRRRP